MKTVRSFSQPCSVIWICKIIVFTAICYGADHISYVKATGLSESLRINGNDYFIRELLTQLEPVELKKAKERYYELQLTESIQLFDYIS